MNPNDDPHRSLHVYGALARFDRIGYAGKIILIAFVGIHVPLLALVVWFVIAGVAGEPVYTTLVVALLATLVGTALTVMTLRHLLRPIERTAAAVRDYVADRTLPTLPNGYGDAAGRLMTDVGDTLHRLEQMRDALEHRDASSGLSNRAGLLRSLVARTEQGRTDEAAPFALCVIDFDDVDEISSAFGRNEADRTLRLVAAALDIGTADGNALHRVGVSTLALIVDSADPEAITAHLATIGERLERLEAEGLDHALVRRLGVSLWPLDDRKADALIDDALVALDVARRRDVPWAFYSESSHRALIERYQLGRELRRALEGDELTLHYQPIVDASGERLVGAEALIRWQHPDRGLLSPGSFIPLAEQSALIERLGLWTLEAVCRQIECWRDDGIVVPRVAINLSARQFADPELAEHVVALTTRHDIPHGALEVELTETSATADVIGAGETMATLRSLGIGMAIDDFGTGYSSLSHLRAMPFDKLKIDREFVQDVDANADRLAICRALIALGRELRLEVLAEGVESAAEVETLRAEGCDLFQGYHFHRPLTPAAFTRLLRERRPEVVKGRLREAS